MKRFLILCLFFTGCTVGPKYKAPEISFSDDWHAQEQIDAAKEGEISKKWWDVFNDPLLSKYIEKSALSNHTVLLAEANIKQARALKKVAASQLFPQLFMDVNASRTYFSKNGPVFAGSSLNKGGSNISGLPFQLQIPQIQNLFNALIDASWELDIFGRIRKGIEMQSALIGSAIEERNAVFLTIFAEIAMNYMELRSAQQLGILTEKNIGFFEEKRIIEKIRKDLGYSKELDLVKIEAQLAVTRSELPKIHAKIYQTIYAISILIGEPPETLLDELLPIQSIPHLPNKITIGLRSDLIRRRPDVRQAERQLAASIANVGIAIASFFPVFTLSGDVGFQSLKLINLFTGMSKTWSIGGDVNLPLFQGGKLIGNLRVSEAQATAAAHNYQDTVLNALKESESTLANYKGDVETFQDWEEAVQKNTQAYKITEVQYTGGLINRIDYINSATTLNASQQITLKIQETALIDLTALYKSLGGGYEPFQEPGEVCKLDFQE